MGILDDLFANEHSFTLEALGFIAEERPLVEELLELVYVSMSGPHPINHPAQASLSRIFTDSCGAVEQTFVSTLRAQPRLGWASLRFAAESLKDMDCIIRHPDLQNAWFAVLQSDPKAHEAALAAFRDARRKLPASDVTQTCSATMKLANVFGAHPNASSVAILGSPRSRGDGVVAHALRATDPDVIRFHLRSQLLHAYPIAVTLADFRLAFMSGEAREILARRREAFDKNMVPFVRARLPRRDRQEADAAG